LPVTFLAALGLLAAGLAFFVGTFALAATALEAGFLTAEAFLAGAAFEEADFLIGLLAFLEFAITRKC
jgi:hypothetical protein